MRIDNPYVHYANWYRGNTHAHSTLSDGRSPVADVVAFYRQAGYDFLCLTDHDVYSNLEAYTDDRFLGIDSLEVTVKGRYHVCAVGTTGLVAAKQAPQATVEDINAKQGLAVVAHPNWTYLNLADVAALRGVMGIEIFNAVCQFLEYNGWALRFWDELLSRGLRIWGVAADDMHALPIHGAQGWVHVNAPQLSREAILANLAAGNFYSSTGAQFHEISVDGNRIRVVTSPAVAVRFRNANLGALKVQYGEHFTAAEYEVQGTEGYVRVDVIDAQGRSAWSNPLFIEA